MTDQREASQIELPQLWLVADQTSAKAQTAFFAWKAAELIGLLLAAASAAIEPSFLDGFGPAFSLIAFAVVIIIQATRAADQAESRWYDARAAAESIKSSAWQYAVGGEAFRLTDTDASNRFDDVLAKVLSSLPRLDLSATRDGARGPTSSMVQLRNSNRRARAQAYEQFRVQDQVEWYAKNAELNRVCARMLRMLVIAVESLALVLGLLRYKYEFSVDVTGILVTAAAGLIAWAQAKKYRLLAESYSVTSFDVDLVASSITEPSTEAEWSQVVHDAEAAFSREHTTWQARRQGPT